MIYIQNSELMDWKTNSGKYPNYGEIQGKLSELEAYTAHLEL